MSSLGSESWVGAGEYEEGSKLHTRVTQAVEKVGWEALLLTASNVRNGVSCKLSEKWSCGHFNVVRKLEFADGAEWIARLRLPLLEGISEEREALGAKQSMEVEIATMRFLKKKTNIPVPEVFHCDLDAHNKVGAAYMLLSYIHGSTAAELRDAKDCEFPLMGTRDQNERFWRQMADIQVQLASCEFDLIGSLHQDGDSFSIGPEVITGKGPWDTPVEYYYDVAAHATALAKTAPNAAEIESSDSHLLPARFPQLIKQYGKADQKRFRLVNRDFGVHNVLVDDEFKIVGIIDLDGVMAAPIETVAQFPAFSGLDRPIPGFQKWEKRPLALQWMAAAAGYLQEYADRIRGAAVSFNSSAVEIAENERWMWAYDDLMHQDGAIARGK